MDKPDVRELVEGRGDKAPRLSKRWKAFFAAQFAFITGGVLCGLDELRDHYKAQPANPFQGVDFDHVNSAEKKKAVSFDQVYCHLANSPEFRIKTPKEVQAKVGGVYSPEYSIAYRASDWADAVLYHLEEMGVEPTRENVELALILMHRESRMTVNPDMSVGNAFKRKKEKMQEKVRETIPFEFVQEAVLGQTDAFFSDREKELLEAKNEMEVHNALIGVSNDLRYVFGYAKLFSPLDSIDERVADLQDGMRVNTFGILQVNPEISIKYHEAKGKEMNRESAVHHLFTLDGNLEDGFAVFFTALEEYKSLGFKKDAVKYAFADYNAGLYSSRNAAFQKQLSQLTGVPLAADGDLLIYDHDGVSWTSSATELAVSKRFPDLDVREALLQEKAADFDESYVYTHMMKGDGVAFAVIPNADDPDALQKYGKEMTASAYTEEAMRQVKDFRWKQCK